MTLSKLVLNDHLGLIWYDSEPLEVPYYPNQYLERDFFAISYDKAAVGNFFSMYE